MGAPGDQGEQYQHRVRITQPFLIGMHQVTQSQYEQIVGMHQSWFRGPDLPVEHVKWNHAMLFCEMLSAVPEEKAAGRCYRLPTEAEWEYACRAGTSTRFNTGDTLTMHQARFRWGGNLSEPGPTEPVGSYQPNPWGLFDMHGNVWEWTSDWFSANFFRESPVDDPQGPATGTHHTLRGGSASVEAYECCSAMRGESASDGPDSSSPQRFAKYGDFGIRVVCQLIGS